MKPDLNEEDLRVRRTRKLLWEALVSLLKEEARFESITIHQICSRAMVHRTTFYKHFEDKYDLLAFGYDNIGEKFNEFTLEERIKHPIRCISQTGNLELFRILSRSLQHNQSLSLFLKNKGDAYMKQDLLELAVQEGSFDVPIDIIAQFYSSVVSGLGMWWLAHGQGISPEEMDDYIAKLINKSVFHRKAD